MMEESLRRAMTISRGDPLVFFTRPISLGLLIISAVMLLGVMIPTIAKKRENTLEKARD
jgi:TctA family transporter